MKNNRIIIIYVLALTTLLVFLITGCEDSVYINLREIERYSSMTLNGTTSIEVSYTDTEYKNYRFVINDEKLIEELMPEIFNMELKKYPKNMDIDGYHRSIKVYQHTRRYDIDLFSITDKQQRYLCKSQKVCDLISKYIENYFWQYANTERSSFLKLKVNSVYDEVFTADGTDRYILLDGTIVKDYYGKIRKDTPITIPVPLKYFTLENETSVSCLLDAAEVKSFLQEYDYLFVYLPSRILPDMLLPMDGDAAIVFDALTQPIALSKYYILPIDNGKVDINNLDTFLKKHEVFYTHHSNIRGFDSIIYDRQEESELVSTIEKMRIDVIPIQ